MIDLFVKATIGRWCCIGQLGLTASIRSVAAFCMWVPPLPARCRRPTADGDAAVAVRIADVRAACSITDHLKDLNTPSISAR